MESTPCVESIEKEYGMESDFWSLVVFYRFPYDREHKGRMELDETYDFCLGISLANQDIAGTSALELT